jgi:hypothetical protein
MGRKYRRELIVIMELIMLILIKVQASDLVMIPSFILLQAPFPPSDPLDNYNGHSPLNICLDTKLESCEERKKKLRPDQFDRCIHIAFINCFGKAIPEDPAYKLIKKCYAFCRVFEEMKYHLYTTCLKICHNRLIKKKHL